MRLTENAILAKKALGNVVHLGFLKENARLVLYSKHTHECMLINPFHGVREPRRTMSVGLDNIVHLKSNIRQKVFNNDELSFLIAYENIRKLGIGFLIKQADGARSSFVLEKEQLVDIFTGLSAFSQRFKHCTALGNYENTGAFKGSYQIVLSLYDINEVIYDVYGRTPTGLGIAVEILTCSPIPRVLFSNYYVFSDTYDGIFYRDGVHVVREILPNFKGDLSLLREYASYFDRAKTKVVEPKVDLEYKSTYTFSDELKPHKKSKKKFARVISPIPEVSIKTRSSQIKKYKGVRARTTPTSSEVPSSTTPTSIEVPSSTTNEDVSFRDFFLNQKVTKYSSRN